MAVTVVLGQLVVDHDVESVDLGQRCGGLPRSLHGARVHRVDALVGQPAGHVQRLVASLFRELGIGRAVGILPTDRQRVCR